MIKRCITIVCFLMVCGCKQDKEESVHQHSAVCSHSAHQASPEKRRPVRAMRELSEEELVLFVDRAKGDMVRSYMLHKYYEDHQNQEESGRWLAETIRILEKAPADDAKANRLRARLGLPNETRSISIQNSVPEETESPSVTPSTPTKRIAPRI